MPVRLPTYAALGSNRDGHELRCLLRRPPPERLLQRLQALPEPGNDEEHGKCRELHGSWVEEDWYAGMCIRHDFGRSGSFETPTQENAKLPRSMVQAVSMTSSCPALPAPRQRHASTTATGAARAVERPGCRWRLAAGGPVHLAALGSGNVHRSRWQLGCRLPDPCEQARGNWSDDPGSSGRSPAMTRRDTRCCKHSVAVQQVTVDSVLAILTVGARRAVQNKPTGLAASQSRRQLANRRSQIASALSTPRPCCNGTDSVNASSKRTWSRLAASEGLAASHLETRMSPFSTIAGLARMWRSSPKKRRFWTPRPSSCRKCLRISLPRSSSGVD